MGRRVATKKSGPELALFPVKVAAVERESADYARDALDKIRALSNVEKIKAMSAQDAEAKAEVSELAVDPAPDTLNPESSTLHPQLSTLRSPP